jgi:hypothetical protein
MAEAQHDFFALLSRSLEAIEREANLAYLQLVQTMQTCLISMRVDGATSYLFAADGRVVVQPQPPRERRHQVELETARATIARLVDGSLGFLDALLSDALWLRGGTDALIVAYDVLMLFLRGALRCPSAPALLDAYLNDGSSSTQPAATQKEIS